MKLSEFNKHAFEISLVKTDGATGEWHLTGCERYTPIYDFDLPELENLSDIIQVLVDRAYETGKLEGRSEYKQEIRGIIKDLITG